MQPLDRTEALNNLVGLRPLSYNMIGSARPEIGFAAQAVDKILPEVVHKSTGPVGADTHRIDYSKMVPMVVAGMQELVSKLDRQSRELGELKQQIAAC